MYEDQVDEASKYLRENLNPTEKGVKIMDEQHIKSIVASPPLTHEAVRKSKEVNDYLKGKLTIIGEKKGLVFASKGMHQ